MFFLNLVPPSLSFALVNCTIDLSNWTLGTSERQLEPASEVFQLFYESITLVTVVTVTCKETHQPSNQIDSLSLQPYKTSSPKATPTAKSCWCSSSTVDHGTRKKCKLVNKMLSLKWAAHCGQIPMQSIQVKNPGDYHHSESQHDFDMITPTGCLSSGVVWKCFEETATPFGKIHWQSFKGCQVCKTSAKLPLHQTSTAANLDNVQLVNIILSQVEIKGKKND